MDNIKDAIKLIEQAVPKPNEGLGNEIFNLVSRLTPMVNVDLLIRNDRNEILLTWRDDQFYGPGWHIPGGILRYKETYAERIEAVARMELGTTLQYEEQPCMVRPAINPSRATRGHFISLLFNCELIDQPDDKLLYMRGEPVHGEWAWHEKKPENLIPVQNVQYGSIF